MNKQFLLIKLKTGEHILHELDKVESVSVLERMYWYREVVVEK